MQDEHVSPRIASLAGTIRNIIQQAQGAGLKDSDKVIAISNETETEVELCTVGELESCVQSLITNAADRGEGAE